MNLLWNSFTIPGNHVLLQAGYQSSQEDTIAALKNTTAAVCTKLKTDTGGKTYDISSEADLKSTLDDIADDIKNFAGGVTPASSGWKKDDF